VGVYAYCAVPRRHAPPEDLRGIEDARVELLELPELGLWVSKLDRPEVTPETVQAHNRVVEVAVTEEVTPVPLRFGQWLDDAARLTESIHPRVAQYLEWLDHFAGCLEFGLRILDPTPRAEAQDVRREATTGTEYMQSLRESSNLAERQRAEAEAVAATVRELLRDVVRDERVEPGQTTHAVVTMSHLVARENFDEYRDRARQVRALFPGLRLLLSGPWPPYSFVV
jgi:hypothetical protein